MKRIAGIKFASIVILSICINTIYSCKEDSITNNNITYNLINSIEGVIYGLPDSARLVKGIVQLEFKNYTMDSVFVDSSNAMILNLKPVQPEFLFDIDVLFFTDTSSIIISDHDVKVNILRLATYYDSSGHFAGELEKNNHTIFNEDSEGYFRVAPFYCDRTLSWTGSHTRINGIDTFKTSYDVNMAEGWNVLTFRNTTRRNNFREGKLFNGEPEGANWYFVSAKE